MVTLRVVLEHVVPHTESLMSVIMTAATNEIFKLKFEFTASVEGEGINKKSELANWKRHSKKCVDFSGGMLGAQTHPVEAKEKQGLWQSPFRGGKRP